MPKIKILDSLLASKIAAGEVIERPSSVLKELIENSLDAGARSISVYLAEGGRRMIRVTDDGCGISREDAPLAFYRHATSKISKEEDLESILTMGFRGEALASIAAVARVRLRTKRPGEAVGVAVTAEGGGEPVVIDDGAPDGTSIEVEDLFYNTPGRLKFLRSPEGEFGRALDVFKRAALINPSVRFRLAHGSSKAIEAPGGSLRERIRDLFGPEVSKSLIEVDTPFLKGFIGTHELTFAGSRSLYLYVNRRSVRDKSINHAVIDGYGTLIEKGRYPFAVLDLIVAPEDVDVNIHPAKSEVRFRNQRFIYDTVRTSVKAALARGMTKAPSPGYEGRASDNFRGAFEPAAAYEFKKAQSFSPEALPFETAEEGALNPEFLQMESVGQLWGEFLIAESRANGGEFFIIDQHGASERSAFERLKVEYLSGGGKAQMLLLPERMETTPDELYSLKAAAGYLERFGFDLYPFGPSLSHGGETFMIKAVPQILSSSTCAGLVKDLASDLSSKGGTSRVEERVEAALMRIACHSVIRGPRTLTREEGNALIKGLARVDFAGHCPHGRPVVRRFTRAEVEAFFKRT